MVESSYLHWICSVPIGATIATLGLIGNILSIIIWNQITKSKSRGNQSTAMFFIALAACDSALLVSFLLHDTLPANHPDLKQNYYYAVMFAWFLFPMFFFALVASIWMVVGVTVNRFVMITFPTRVNVLYTRVRTKFGIFGILLFAFCVNLPHFFTYKVDEKDGKYQLNFTEYGHSDASINYEFWAHCIVLVLGPWFIIAVLNAAIILKLRQQRQKFRHFTDADTKLTKSKQQRREQQMTRMLLVVTFSFLILLAWQCITQCFWMLQYGKHSNNQSRWVMVDKSFALAKLGVILNSSINWCLYCITSSMFRKQMRLLTGIRLRRGARTSTTEFSDLSSTASTLAHPSTKMFSTKL